MVKHSMKRLSPRFSTNRMLTEYAERFYIPAAQRYSELKAAHGEKLSSIVEWRKGFQAMPSPVKITHVESVDGDMRVGSKLHVKASVFLGDLRPENVRVQVFHGPLDADGTVLNGSCNEMARVGSIGTEQEYEGQVELTSSGSCGFCVRVIPYHHDVLIPYEQPWVIWAE
jgi:starch phosphorylase